MSLYVPNVGELEMMRSILAMQEWTLGLHKNVVSQDGSVTMLNVEELTTGGGRGYAPKTLSMDFSTVFDADKWKIAINSSGKAEAQYSDDYLEWEFNATDVADGETVYGVFGYTNVIPFDAGAVEIKVGDIIEGGTSGATGIVTGVVVTSGTWGAGTAAGQLYIKTKTGTFQNDEDLIINGKVATIAIDTAGTGYAEGDIVEITQTGGAGTKVVILEVAVGVPTVVGVVEGGQGHTVDTALPTVALTGAGNDDLTLDITTLDTATVVAVSNTGTLYAGDAHKQLLFQESLPTAQEVDVSGRKIRVLVKWTLKSE